MVSPAPEESRPPRGVPHPAPWQSAVLVLATVVVVSFVAFACSGPTTPSDNVDDDPRVALDDTLPRTHAPRPTVAAVTEEDLRTRVYIFADDSMQGRASGTEGYRRAADYVAGELERLGLQPAGDDGSYFQELPIASGGPAPMYNIVAILPGADAALRDQYVALGAHADHLGTGNRPVDHDSLRAFNQKVWWLGGAYGAPASVTPEKRAAITVNLDSIRKIRAPRPDSIANGADDDGSGSMALLEIAESLALGDRKPARSVLFVWHVAEELGLWGSNYYTEHPTVPRGAIVAQVNLDMIGRGSRRDLVAGGPDYLMSVGASRLSSELGALVEQVASDPAHAIRLDYTMDANGHPERIYCRSDHYSYARWGIPVVFFFTGLHGDYHQVTDEAQYLDYPHYARITSYIQDLVLTIANRQARLVVDGPVPDPYGRCVQ